MHLVSMTTISWQHDTASLQFAVCFLFEIGTSEQGGCGCLTWCGGENNTLNTTAYTRKKKKSDGDVTSAFQKSWDFKLEALGVDTKRWVGTETCGAVPFLWVATCCLRQWELLKRRYWQSEKNTKRTWTLRSSFADLKYLDQISNQWSIKPADGKCLPLLGKNQNCKTCTRGHKEWYV